ncbi:hypothetical protein AK812_SmicGene21236 [Symbiodinium microadriaticum]|uniref:C2H2-type domain-containing protein n=1 Tax=Symbiodinium microadriaticum TaxID=2951 RepID=A0A1Q9DMX1_SYMMI|nr:hypothetical protein AK812_SmicGene21236 [Symbiodinium microadriaticum]
MRPAQLPVHSQNYSSLRKRSFISACRRAVDAQQPVSYRGQVLTPAQVRRSGNCPPQHQSRGSGRPTRRRAGLANRELRVLSWNAGHLGQQQWAEIKSWLQTEAKHVCDVLQETHWQATAEFSVAGWYCVSSASEYVPTKEDTTLGGLAQPAPTQPAGALPNQPRPRRKSLRGSKGPSTTKADGVMVLLSPEVPTNTVRWKEHKQGRLLEIRFDWHGARATVLAVYQHVWSPAKTVQANKQDRAAVLKALSRCVRSVPTRDTLVVAGDFNSSVSTTPRLVGPRTLTPLEARPDEAELTNFVRTHHLAVLNTWQVTSPHTFEQGDSRTQIDFLLTKVSSSGGSAKQAAPLANFPLGSWKTGMTPPEWDALLSKVDAAITAGDQFVAYKVLKKLRPWQPSQKAQLQDSKGYLLSPTGELQELRKYATDVFGKYPRLQDNYTGGDFPRQAHSIHQAGKGCILRPDAKGLAGLSDAQSRVVQHLREAFDTVSRQDILDQLQALSVEPSLVSLVHALHHSSKYRLHAQGGYTEVETTTGIKQGCKLAPTLFSVLTGRLLHMLIDTFGLEAVQQHLTGYADDISVHKTIRSRRDLQLAHDLIQALLAAVGRLRLRVNSTKCSVMVRLSGTEAPSVMRRHICWLPDASGVLQKHWRIGANKAYPAFRLEGPIKYLGISCWYAQKLRSVLNQPAHITHVTTSDLLRLHKLQDPVEKTIRRMKGRIAKLRKRSGSVQAAAADVTLHSHILIDLDRILQEAQAIPVPTQASQTPAYNCHICQASFDTEHGLRMHTAKMHRDSLSRFIPPLFDRELHAKDGMPVCAACGRSFKQWKGLRDHLLSGACPAPDALRSITSSGTLSNSSLLVLATDTPPLYDSGTWSGTAFNRGDSAPQAEGAAPAGVGDLQAVQWQGRTDGQVEAADIGESPLLYKVRAGVFHIGAEVTSGDDAVRPSPASASDAKRVREGLNSPDAKCPRGGRSPLPEDADMTDRPQLRLPKERGALGRDSGGSGDRQSAPRAAPGRRITALSPEELTQGFLLHEEQLALLQHQVSIVFKFPEDAPMARSLMKAVREWQAEHKAGTAHPWGSCAHYTAAALLKELAKIEDPPKNFSTADIRHLQKVVKELGPDPHESLVHMVSYCSARLSAKKEHVILDFRPVLNTVLARQSELISSLLDGCEGERLGKRAPGALVRKATARLPVLKTTTQAQRMIKSSKVLFSRSPPKQLKTTMPATKPRTKFNKIELVWKKKVTSLPAIFHQEARTVLDAMALLDDPRNTAGQAIGKGNSAEVHACQSNPRFVIRTVRQQDEVEWQRELSRLRRVPALSVITTVFATSGRSSLMPRLWPIPRGALRTTEVIRLKYDISAALEMLHRSHIVHADVHADNLMLRAEPPCFVLIDYSGCTGDSVYPLHLPVRTAHGDYYRLARTILKQLYIGPEPSKRRHSDKDTSLPSHLDKELRIWLERDQWANGEIKQDTATFTSPDSKFGNFNGTLVPEGVANDGMQGTGSWENSAISARFFLKCQLRTCGRFARTIYQEIFPWQAYSNQDGYLVPANPPPPPPAASVSDLHEVGTRALSDSVQAGQRDLRSTPVQGAIHTAAVSLSAAISLAQDLGQERPSMTHHSLAQSLKVTSEILLEASEELMEVARNQPSSTAPAATPAADVHMECDD